MTARPREDQKKPTPPEPVDISDGIFLLGSLFQGGPPPPEPHPNAGVDPTPDGLPDC